MKPSRGCFSGVGSQAVPVTWGWTRRPPPSGRNYLGPASFVAHAPSGTGWQLSVLGLAGITVAREEGLELNLLGLGFGIDVNDLKLRLPGLGKFPSPLPALAAEEAGGAPARVN